MAEMVIEIAANPPPKMVEISKSELQTMREEMTQMEA